MHTEMGRTPLEPIGGHCRGPVRHFRDFVNFSAVEVDVPLHSGTVYRMTSAAAPGVHRIVSDISTARRRRPRRGHVPHGRTLHLLDIENLAGEARPSRASATEAFDRLGSLTPVGPHDHVVLGAHTVLAASIGIWWPHHRVVTGTGPDAADLALIDVVADAEWIADHYHRVIIGSGDHIFTDTVTRLRRSGLVVGVVSRDCALSSDLRRAASFTRTWSEDVIDAGELAVAA